MMTVTVYKTIKDTPAPTVITASPNTNTINTTTTTTLITVRPKVTMNTHGVD